MTNLTSTGQTRALLKELIAALNVTHGNELGLAQVTPSGCPTCGLIHRAQHLIKVLEDFSFTPNKVKPATESEAEPSFSVEFGSEFEIHVQRPHSDDFILRADHFSLHYNDIKLCFSSSRDGKLSCSSSQPIYLWPRKGGFYLEKGDEEDDE